MLGAHFPRSDFKGEARETNPPLRQAQATRDERGIDTSRQRARRRRGKKPGEEHFSQVAADTEHERGRSWTSRWKQISIVPLCKATFWWVYFFKGSCIIQLVNTEAARCCTEKEPNSCSGGVPREFHRLVPGWRHERLKSPNCKR